MEQFADRLDDHRRLIRLPSRRPVVFVGDTHGDREATELVLERYPASAHTLVFLGDVVDRGPDSRGNLDLVLSAAVDHPDAIHLLMGNHEAYAVAPFSPADFWEGLAPDDARRLGEILIGLPWAAWHPAGVLAVHGAVPEVPSLEALETIIPGSAAWRAITWGDWEEPQVGGLPGGGGGRPRFDRTAFETRMGRLGARVLVRSHQPLAPTYLFDDRCLTLFTSKAYGDGARRVAVLSPDRPVETVRDLELVDL